MRDAVPLPDAALDDRWAIVGTSGAGKTYAARGMMERLLRADATVCWVDALGVAYGLTRDELRYILDPADVKGPDYPSETFRVLKEKEIRQHGEYRTRRLVLEAWDRMEADGTFVVLGLGLGQVAATAPTIQRQALATPGQLYARARFFGFASRELPASMTS